MRIKWYWPAEQLGLVKDLTTQYNDGSIHYQVSARADEVFFTLFLSLIPLLFFWELLLCFPLHRSKQDLLARRLTVFPALTLLCYGLLLSFGIAPYIQFYPKGSGFFSLDTLENIIRGLYCALLSFSLFLGGKAGRFLAVHCTKPTEYPR